MLWINEGFTLDDAGNVVSTSYVDLRDEGERVAIRSLVKGCRREHALEDGENVLISKPERFREYGPALIRDEQEGFAREEQVTVEAETPKVILVLEAERYRYQAAISDLAGSDAEAGEFVVPEDGVLAVDRESVHGALGEGAVLAFGHGAAVLRGGFCAAISVSGP